MDLKSALLWSIGAVGAVALSATGRVIGDDVKEWTPRLTRRVVEFAVSRMPQKHRDRAAAEWVAELLADTPGVLAKWWYALTCVWAAERETLRNFKETFLSPLDAEREALVENYVEGIENWVKEGKEIEPWIWTIKVIMAKETPTWVLLCIRGAYLQFYLKLFPKSWRMAIFLTITRVASKHARKSAVWTYVRQTERRS